MNRKTIVLALCAMLAVSAFAQNIMTDQQIIDYYEQGIAEGKTREDIAKELALRGVTREQAERVARIYQSREQAANAAVTMGDRTHRVGSVPETALSSANPSEVLPDEENEVWGRGIFRQSRLNFAPGANMPTPRNYRLGPGDEVIIDIFGASQRTIRQTISPEGSINVEFLGPVYLNGMTVDEANAYVKRKLSSIYTGLNYGGSQSTNLRLTLGQIRSIQINVIGEVRYPGTYNISSFATVFHALYMAGGIVEPGSMRDITVSRGGKTVGKADVYEFMTSGSQESDIRLEDGDVILVSPYTEMVKINGMVKRPMYFEMIPGETLAQLISYAGGFANGAYTDNISVIRQNGKSFEVRTVERADFTRFVLQDGDEVTVNKLQSRFENRISVSGAVFFPGTYELNEELRTVKQLVAKAGGLLPEAFTDRVVVNRERADRTHEVVSLNLDKILSGADPDFVLRNNDELTIASRTDLTEVGTMTISGMVSNPGTFPYAANTTVEDLIVMAGGLKNGASMSRVDVIRRIRDEYATEASKEIGELHSLSIKDGLVADGDRGFVLEPFDEVVVRESPSYNEQMHVQVVGQVNFPGTYSITERGERLSDAIRKAGGITQFSYPRGARLTRRMDAAARKQAEDALQALRTSDTTAVDVDALIMQMADVYPVAIDLEQALANPGGPDDIVLRQGDRIDVPLYYNTVRVSGAVNAPGVFSYVPGKRAGAYIERAGGYGIRPYKSRAYIISLNGNKQPLNQFSKIQPGDEIVVPQKEKKEVDVRSNVLAYSSAAASLTTMTVAIMTMLNQNKSSK